jgi:hypothetical protein
MVDKLRGAAESKRQNGMPSIHAVNERVQQEADEPEGVGRPPLRALQSGSNPSDVALHASDGSGSCGPALDRAGIDRSSEFLMSHEPRSEKNAEHQARQQGAERHSLNILKRKDMDLIIFWFPIIGGGILAAIAISAAFTVEHKPLAIWCGFAGAVLLGFVFCLQLQQKVWESKERNTPVAPATTSPEFISFKEKSDEVTFTLGGLSFTTTVERLTRESVHPFGFWRLFAGSFVCC